MAVQPAGPCGLDAAVGDQGPIAGHADLAAVGVPGQQQVVTVGRPYHGWRVILLINGLNIQIISPDGAQLRKLTLDPAKDYQPLS